MRGTTAMAGRKWEEENGREEQIGRMSEIKRKIILNEKFRLIKIA